MCFSKPSLEKLISTDSKTPTWYSIYQLPSWFILQTSSYDVSIDFHVDSKLTFGDVCRVATVREKVLEMKNFPGQGITFSVREI